MISQQREHKGTYKSTELHPITPYGRQHAVRVPKESGTELLSEIIQRNKEGKRTSDQTEEMNERWSSVRPTT